jgi:membrane protein required for colicin V production
MEWTKLDYFIALLVAISVALSFAKGFVRELISLAALAGGILAAAWGYGALAPWFLDYVKTPEIASLAAFLTILACAIAVGALVSSAAGAIVKKTGLRWADRVLGAAFGLLRGVLLALALVMALVAFPPGTDVVKNSALAPYLIYGSRALAASAPAEVRRKFAEGRERAREFWNAQRAAPTGGAPNQKQFD